MCNMTDPLLIELQATGVLSDSKSKGNPMASVLTNSLTPESVSFDTKLAQALRSILEPTLVSMRAKLDRLVRAQVQVQKEIESLATELQGVEQFINELKDEVEHDVQEVQ